MDHNQKQQPQPDMKPQRDNGPETLEEMAAQEPANNRTEGKDSAPTFPKAR